MLYSKTEGQIIFQLKTMRFSPDLERNAELNLVLYDIKTRRILQTIVPFEILLYEFFHRYMTYFVDHVDFEGGIIVVVAYNVNEVRVFARNGGANSPFSTAFHLNFVIISVFFIIDHILLLITERITFYFL